MIFARGGSWHSIYTFDVGKLPAKVSVKLSGEAPITVDCSYRVGSPLAISTQDDVKRVSEQLDVLVAYVTGATQ